MRHDDVTKMNSEVKYRIYGRKYRKNENMR